MEVAGDKYQKIPRRSGNFGKALSHLQLGRREFRASKVLVRNLIASLLDQSDISLWYTCGIISLWLSFSNYVANSFKDGPSCDTDTPKSVSEFVTHPRHASQVFKCHPRTNADVIPNYRLRATVLGQVPHQPTPLGLAFYTKLSFSDVTLV
ncbi:hypothetical protein PoB_003985100 [Plakobranchus ocellatus]|uniref:Seipin n=1 Tax=Plakobranchus ocellatus TaxID=259542 RepID=A0AAV4AQB8_9GAST|nr:hypothetical protein PoB_003985100 [Plakobranchus ocellatus]